MNETRDIFENLLGARDNSTCEVCGNHYDKCLLIRKDGETHVFDSLECAIHALAPRCEHCGCRIVGHGMETDEYFFCSAHCARSYGVVGLDDRLENQNERKPK